MTPLHHIFQHTDFENLIKRIQHMHTLQSVWCKLPALHTHRLVQYTTAVQLIQQELTVLAQSGSIATRLKLVEVTLLSALQKQGYEVTKLCIKVQAKK